MTSHDPHRTDPTTQETTHQEAHMIPTDPHPDAGPEDYPAGRLPDQERAELVYERWRELGFGLFEVLATVALAGGLAFLAERGTLAELLAQAGRWGWFAAGAAALMYLDMAFDAVGRLSRAGWLLWLTYHPAPTAVPATAPLWVRLAARGGRL